MTDRFRIFVTVIASAALPLFAYQIWAAYNMYDPFWGAP